MSIPHYLWQQRAVVCLGLLAFSITLCLGAVGGYCLNLLICSAMAVALVVPAFGCYCRGLAGGLRLVGTTVAGVLGGWVTIGHGGHENAGQLLRCAAVIAGVTWAEISLCTMMVGWRIAPVVAGAAVAVLGLIWLAWPLWATTAPPLCVRVHPLLVMNGVVSDDWGIWTEEPIAYPWIAVGQDVSYRLPTSPWPCVVFHAVLGLAAYVMLPSWRRRLRNTNETFEKLRIGAERTAFVTPPRPVQSSPSRVIQRSQSG